MEDEIRTLDDLLKPTDKPEITEKQFIKRWNHFDLKPGNVIDINFANVHGPYGYRATLLINHDQNDFYGAVIIDDASRKVRVTPLYIGPEETMEDLGKLIYRLLGHIQTIHGLSDKYNDIDGWGYECY
ncbi:MULTISPECIES: hypothetical protein [Lactobacillus]|uniref:hypothetical protein n=1 Tax=Lactobacillus TaxID=1578 RepID=UPI000CD85C17|nr:MULTISPECIES: hypothetical protein [Lactobacillus]RVU73506.1 hypothetical protein EJK20_07680 [Lactobacillus xujianguonis]